MAKKPRPPQPADSSPITMQNGKLVDEMQAAQDRKLIPGDQQQQQVDSDLVSSGKLQRLTQQEYEDWLRRQSNE